MEFLIDRDAVCCGDCGSALDRYGRCVEDASHLARERGEVEIALTVEAEYEPECRGYGQHPDYSSSANVSRVSDAEGYEWLWLLTKQEQNRARDEYLDLCERRDW